MQIEMWLRERGSSGLKLKNKQKPLIWKFATFHKKAELWLPIASLMWKRDIWDMFVTTSAVQLMCFWETCLLQGAWWAIPGEEDGGGKTRDAAVSGTWCGQTRLSSSCCSFSWRCVEQNREDRGSCAAGSVAFPSDARGGCFKTGT